MRAGAWGRYPRPDVRLATEAAVLSKSNADSVVIGDGRIALAACSVMHMLTTCSCSAPSAALRWRLAAMSTASGKPPKSAAMLSKISALMSGTPACIRQELRSCGLTSANWQRSTPPSMLYVSGANLQCRPAGG